MIVTPMESQISSLIKKTLYEIPDVQVIALDYSTIPLEGWLDMLVLCDAKIVLEDQFETKINFAIRYKIQTKEITADYIINEFTIPENISSHDLLKYTNNIEKVLKKIFDPILAQILHIVLQYEETVE